MAEPTVWTFFYGSFVNLDVLKQGGFVPKRYEVARLSGFDIRIQPLATLVRSDQHCVYGIVALGTHEQLRRLYSQEWLGTYLPEPVLVETLDGKWRAGRSATSPRQANPDRPATTTSTASLDQRGTTAFLLGTSLAWSVSGQGERPSTPPAPAGHS
jgi:hypothetical protein